MHDIFKSYLVLDDIIRNYIQRIVDYNNIAIMSNGRSLVATAVTIAVAAATIIAWHYFPQYQRPRRLKTERVSNDSEQAQPTRWLKETLSKTRHTIEICLSDIEGSLAPRCNYNISRTMVTIYFPPS